MGLNSPHRGARSDGLRGTSRVPKPSEHDAGHNIARPRRRIFKRSACVLGVGVFGVALTVRAAVGLGTRAIPFVMEPLGDARSYLVWGVTVAEGDLVGSAPFYQAPLYPYVLGAMISLVGDAPSTLRYVQIVWGALGAAMLGLATARMFGRRAGWAAGLLMAVYPPACFFDLIIQKASLDALLISAWLLVMSSCAARATARHVLVAGVMLGLLALTRENALVWAPCAALWLNSTRRRFSGGSESNRPPDAGAARPRRRVDLTLPIVLLGGAAMPLTLVALRNHAVCGEWSPTTFQAGPNFYIGNSAEADGRYRPLVRGHETPEYERADAVRLAERAEDRSLTAGEVSSYWLRRAWADMAASPGRWLRLMGVKLLMTVNDYEVGDVESQTAYAAHLGAFRAMTSIWHFGVLLPLAGAGALLMRRRRRQVALLLTLSTAMALAVAAFYVLARYRYPLAVLLMPLAGAGVVRACGLIARRRWSALRWPAAVAGALAIVSNGIHVHPERELDAMALSNLGVAYARQGQGFAVDSAFQQAVAMCPNSPEALFNLGMLRGQAGKTEDAIGYLKRASECAGDLAEVDYCLGTLLEQTGRSSEAIDRYRRAMASNPADGRAAEALRRLGATSNR